MAAGQRRERVGRPQPLHVVRPRAGSVGPRPCGIVARASRPLPPLRAAGEPALRHRGSARGRVVRCRRRALRIVGANGRLPGARVHPHGCGVGGPGHVHHSERVCGGGLRAVAGVYLVHARAARGRVLGGQPVLGLGASGRRGGAGRHRRRGGRRGRRAGIVRGVRQGDETPVARRRRRQTAVHGGVVPRVGGFYAESADGVPYGVGVRVCSGAFRSFFAGRGRRRGGKRPNKGDSGASSATTRWPTSSKAW